MNLDEYFSWISDLIRTSPILHSPQITFERRGPFLGFIRGDVILFDESHFHFREFINTQNGIERYTYVYQYQRADGTLIFRYDNTPHYPGLPKAPDHKHTISAGVVPSNAPSLADVLDEIDRLIT
jgi:hypothetical protein